MFYRSSLIIKNISLYNDIIYKLYKINNMVIIQLKKFMINEKLFFHSKQIQKKIMLLINIYYRQ